MLSVLSFFLILPTFAGEDPPAEDEESEVDQFIGWTDPGDQAFLQLVVDDMVSKTPSAFAGLEDALGAFEVSQELADLEVLAGLDMIGAFGGSVVELESFGNGSSAADIYDPITGTGGQTCDDALCAGAPDGGSLSASGWSASPEENGEVVWFREQPGTNTTTGRFIVVSNGEVVENTTIVIQKDGVAVETADHFNDDGTAIRTVTRNTGGATNEQVSVQAVPAKRPQVPTEGSTDEPAYKPQDPKKDFAGYPPADGTEGGSYCPLSFWGCRDLAAEAEAQMRNPYRMLEGSVHILTAGDESQVAEVRLMVDSGDLVSDPDSKAREVSGELGHRVFRMSIPVLVLPPGPNE